MAGEYVEFVNNSQPALNEDNLNLMQQRIKQDIQGAVSGDTLPVGAIMPFGSDTIPENWLLCDGQAVSRTEYQDLFNTIGITFGQGDGFTTFNLPNLQGKVVVGKDENDEDFDLLGETGGEKEHTLTIGEMPEHDHSMNSRTQSGEVYGLVSSSGNTTSIGEIRTNKTGGGEPHNILQPYQVQNYIIKAKQSAGIVATVVDSLDSTSTTDALSVNQGKILNEKIIGTILFESANGVGFGTDITISETSANYSYLEIFYGRSSTENTLSSVKVENPNGKQFGMSIIYPTSNNLTMQIYGARIIINGTSLTWNASAVTTISSTTISSTSATDVLKVYKIIGYK